MNVSTNWAKEKHKEGVNGINYIPKAKGKKTTWFHWFDFNADAVSNRKYWKNF